MGDETEEEEMGINITYIIASKNYSILYKHLKLRHCFYQSKVGLAPVPNERFAY